MFTTRPFIADPRVYNEAKALIDAGNDLAVIELDRLKEHESEAIIDGIITKRIYCGLSTGSLPNYLLFYKQWWKKAYKKALELYNNGFKFDIVHCHDLDTLKIGVRLKKKFGVKLIYDSHDLFISFAKSKNFPNFVINLINNFEKKLLIKVDEIITVNEPMKKHYQSITDKTVNIIMNCKELIGDYKKPNNKTFTIVYIGGIGKARFFPELVDIVGNIENVKFIIAGKKEDIWKEVERRSKLYKNVDYIGTIEFREVLPQTLKADAVIALCDPDIIGTKIATQNKQFEAMVCGRPIIVTKGTYSGEMTETLKCGLATDYNEEPVKDAIIKLRDNPKLCEELGKNALKAALDNYNWNLEKKKLVKIYQKLEK